MIRRSVAIGCLVFGSVALYIGYEKTQTVMSGLRRAFGGNYSREAIAWLVGGGVLILAGLLMLSNKKVKYR